MIRQFPECSDIGVAVFRKQLTDRVSRRLLSRQLLSIKKSMAHGIELLYRFHLPLRARFIVISELLQLINELVDQSGKYFMLLRVAMFEDGRLDKLAKQIAE